MADQINVIIKKPNETFGHTATINNTLERFQMIVKGYIECVPLGFVLGKGNVVIICNEEGRLMGMEHSCTVCGIDFCGPIIAVGVDGEEFADVPIDFEDWLKLMTL